MYGLCRLLLHDRSEAEDAAQEVFLSAFSALLAGHEPRDATAWIVTIARNECRARRRRLLALPLTEHLESGAAGPEEATASGAEFEALLGALRELPERQRDAVLLRDFYGLRYREVGAVLGLSRPAVESLLFRARRRVRGRLRTLRQAVGGLVLPATLEAVLSEAIPGFGAGSTAGGGATVAGLGIAKLVPGGAKVAVATLAAGAAGTAGVVGGARHPDSVREAAPRGSPAIAPARSRADEDAATISARPAAPAAPRPVSADAKGRVPSADRDAEEADERERAGRSGHGGGDRGEKPRTRRSDPSAGPSRDDDDEDAGGGEQAQSTERSGPSDAGDREDHSGPSSERDETDESGSDRGHDDASEGED